MMAKNNLNHIIVKLISTNLEDIQFYTWIIKREMNFKYLCLNDQIIKILFWTLDMTKYSFEDKINYFLIERKIIKEIFSEILFIKKKEISLFKHNKVY
jgi:hypothetical protein